MKFSRRAAIGLFALALTLTLAAPSRGQMSPEKQLEKIKVPDDMQVQLFASEPMITNPSAIDVDTQGRVWMAEIQFYRGKAKTNPPEDKIKVLIDSHGTGHADKVVTFAEHVFCPMSICVAGDKVYVATSPDLWVYTIKETPDGPVADGPPKKLLTGFGGFNHDHGAHSLVLGPDHKWWMSHGDTGFDVRGTDGSHIQYQWGGVLRGELDGGKLETVAVNFRNPYEVCVSSFGEPFLSDNDNDGLKSTRICWIMEGGNYGWFGHPGERVPEGTPFGEHWHFRGQIPGFVPASLVTGFGSPTGICYYEGDAFGKKYKDMPLHTDCGPAEVRRYPYEKAGAGMKASLDVFMTCGDRYFRPDDICAAPDGSLYVSDWYDGGVGGHAYNNPDQGRIFKLTPKGKKLTRHEKPGPYANIPDAIEGLKSPNLATQYLARERLLTEGQGSATALKGLLADPEPNFRARALWVLDRLGGDSRKRVLDELKNPAAEWRALAVRILRRHEAEYADAILPLADDSSLEVVREVLLAIRTIPGERADDAVVKIAARYDGTDRYLLEAINIAAGSAERKQAIYARLAKPAQFSPQLFALMQLLSPAEAAKMLTAKLSQPDLDPAVARVLLAAAGASGSPEAGRGLLALLANERTSPELRGAALEKLAGNLGGSWRPLADDDQLTAVFRKLLADKSLQQAVLGIAAKQNLKKLGGDVLALVRSPQTDLPLRKQALATVVQLRPEGTIDALRDLSGDNQAALRDAAVEALVELQDVKTILWILSSDQFAPAIRARVAERMMSNTGGALALLKLLDDKKLPADLQKLVIAKAAAHPDANVRSLYEKYIPESDRPQKLGQAIKAEQILALAGDALRGGKIFRESSAAQCKNCHAVDGVGGTLGPDLSLIGKKYERGVLLESILDPSKAIAPEYISYIVETTDGLPYVGFLVEQHKSRIVLKDAQGKLIQLATKQIESITPQKKSVMPELVLRDVTAQDAADLLAYLQTLRQDVEKVKRFRTLGPFDANDKKLDTKLGPELAEGNLANPDLTAAYDGVGGKKCKWESYTSGGEAGFPVFDTIQYDRARGVNLEHTIHYALVYADTPTDQRATLLASGDDQIKLWVNGQEVLNQQPSGNGVQWGQYKTEANLKKGRNVILLKVLNLQGPGGACLGIRGTDSLQIKTE